MDQSKFTGKWKQLKGRIKQEWGAITDDDLKEGEGHLDYLVGKIEERTGESRDKVRKKLKELEANI